MISVYSDWKKVDLHIHTNASNQTKPSDYAGEFSVSTLKKKLIDNHVEIFSLTDHNIINIAAYQDYYSTYQQKSDPLLLVGVELDLQVEGIRYHTLIIFNCSSLECCKSISEKLEDAYSAKGISDKTERFLELGELSEIFKDNEFFFIPHAGNNRSIVEAYKDNIEYAQRMVLLMPSVAFEKVNSEKTVLVIETVSEIFDAFNSSFVIEDEDVIDSTEHGNPVLKTTSS